MPPLPPMDEVCRAIEAFPRVPTITFPGGATLIPQVPGIPPSLLELSLDLLGKANAALVPLSPLFDVIEVVVALQKCLTAVVDALGPPPDPSKLAKCLPELARKVEAVIALLPPVSVVKMVADIVDAIIALLDGVIAELRGVAALIERATRAEDLSDSCPELVLAAACARSTADQQLENIGRALGSVNGLISVANGFVELAGLPPLPILASLPGDPLGAIELLETVSDSLQSFRDTIPVS